MASFWAAVRWIARAATGSASAQPQTFICLIRLVSKFRDVKTSAGLVRIEPIFYLSRLSAVDSADCAEPGGDDRQLLRYDGDEALSLEVGDGVLIPVRRDGASACNGSLGEGVFPVDGPLEAVPGVWPTGGDEGNILVAALDGDTVLEPGSVVAEIRAGRVDTTACGCGAVETRAWFLRTPKQFGRVSVLNRQVTT